MGSVLSEQFVLLKIFLTQYNETEIKSPAPITGGTNNTSFVLLGRESLASATML